MGSGDYTAVTNGALKLKGVKGSRIDKPKKKKKRAKESTPTDQPKDTADGSDVEGAGKDLGNELEKTLKKALDEELADPEDGESTLGVGKTEAERRHEERRRKRVRSLLIAVQA